MGIFSRSKGADVLDNRAASESSHDTRVADAQIHQNGHTDTEKDIDYDTSPVPFLTARTVMMTIIGSMAGMVYGYDTGQIS